MAKVTMSTEVAMNADSLWQAVGSFAKIADWHPMITKAEVEGEHKGSIRTLHLAGGGTITERLEEISASERVYRYSIISSSLPVANYTSEVKVHDNGDGTSTVEWSSDFQSQAGVPEGDAVKLMQDLYKSGLDNLTRVYGMKG